MKYGQEMWCLIVIQHAIGNIFLMYLLKYISSQSNIIHVNTWFQIWLTVYR
jgi:hypothetical protein